MSGNVWEWTGSRYEPCPYSEADDYANLDGDALFVIRGGHFERLVQEGYEKLQSASNRASTTTRSGRRCRSRAIVDAYIRDPLKLPLYIDLLNINLDNHDLAQATRVRRLIATFRQNATRLTENQDGPARSVPESGDLLMAQPCDGLIVHLIVQP